MSMQEKIIFIYLFFVQKFNKTPVKICKKEHPQTSKTVRLNNQR